MENECVKHKALDFVGDLYRLGAPIRGRFNVVQARPRRYCRLRGRDDERIRPRKNASVFVQQALEHQLWLTVEFLFLLE